LKIFTVPPPVAVCQGRRSVPPEPGRGAAPSGSIDQNTRELGLTGLRGWLATAPRATDRLNLTG
jgi:hypothetical protein